MSIYNNSMDLVLFPSSSCSSNGLSNVYKNNPIEQMSHCGTCNSLYKGLRCKFCYPTDQPMCTKCGLRTSNPGYPICQPCYSTSRPQPSRNMAHPKQKKHNSSAASRRISNLNRPHLNTQQSWTPFDSPSLEWFDGNTLNNSFSSQTLH
eukprot:NODE_4677_length_1132_cov_11.804757_g4150_i0.p1 GENE.NODE_4677_length_1132_cov_11.804757_g4150_i0~~NODE_4677_length_1132_cov_11.804757_g4150_i0.p1  ORF type:complete len:149 (-),score=14.64 NODE_4677_length_1132_cov_11.804757_g4150_i0:634-1080(-)